MSRRLLGALAALVAAAAATPATAVATPATDDYVVVLRDGVSRPGAAADALERARGFATTRRFSAALDGFAATLTAAQAERLSADPAVDYVVADVAVRGDLARETGDTDSVPTGVRRVGAGAAPASGTAAVAVLDTGIDLDNDDLDAVTGVNCVRPGAPAEDRNGHGTHVAGTIAGSGGGRRGVVGVAPGARVHAVKVLDRKGGGTLSGILCGLDWVAREAPRLGIRAVNLSLGAPGRADGQCGRAAQDAMHAAICRIVAAGVTVVASAGNLGAPIGGAIPAVYPEVLTVTGMTDTDGAPGGRGPAPCVEGEADDTVWSGSNHGTTAADAAHLIAAPATCVVSSKRGGGRTTMTGTSMAAPHVTGAVARCVGAPATPGPCAGLSPDEIIARLRGDAAAAARAGLGFAGDAFAPLGDDRVFGALVDASY